MLLLLEANFLHLILPVAFLLVRVGWPPPLPRTHDHDHGRGGGGGTRNLQHIYIYIFNLQNICTCHHPLDTNAVSTSFKCKRGKSHVTTCDCAKPWEGTMAVVRRAKQIVWDDNSNVAQSSPLTIEGRSESKFGTLVKWLFFVWSRTRASKHRRDSSRSRSMP